MHNQHIFLTPRFYRVSSALANILWLINAAAADADSPDGLTGRIFMHAPRHKLTFQLGGDREQEGAWQWVALSLPTH